MKELRHKFQTVFKRINRQIALLAREEQGVVAVVAAAGMVTLFGFAALTVDVGRAYVVKQRLQDVADAASLAGARFLPDSSCLLQGAPPCPAETAAREVVAGNNLQVPVTITFPDASTIRVEAAEQVQTALAGVLSSQLGQLDVSAASLAGGGGPSALDGSRDRDPEKDSDGDGTPDIEEDSDGDHIPDCEEDSDHDGIKDCDDPEPYIKDNGNGDEHCHDDDDGSGHDHDEHPECYDDWNIVHDGAVPLAVEEGTFQFGQLVSLKVGAGDANSGNFHAVTYGCRTGSDAFENYLKFGFDGVVSIGEELDTEPGNMSGPSKKGVEWRISLDPRSTYDNVRKGSPRVVFLPVITSFQDANGRDMVRVQGFVAFFLEGFDQTTGAVNGRFIQWGIAADAGGPSYGLNVVRLKG